MSDEEVNTADDQDTSVDEVQVEFPENGTVVSSTTDGDAKVVHDVDENGNVLGWHKEPADGSTPDGQEHVVASLLSPTQEFIAEETETDEESN